MLDTETMLGACDLLHRIEQAEGPVNQEMCRVLTYAFDTVLFDDGELSEYIEQACSALLRAASVWPTEGSSALAHNLDEVRHIMMGDEAL